jgi:hypothetical protein
MIVDIKNTTVYLVSPGTGKYKDRVLTVFSRLIDAGFSKIEFIKSLPGLNGAASLTHTVLHIFKRELNNNTPFIILEDDCAFFNKYDQIEIPEDYDMLYLGVSKWAYTHPIETFYYMDFRPPVIQNSPETVQSYDDTLTKLKGMTATHAILYNSRKFIKRFMEILEDINKHYDLSYLPHDLLFSALHSTHNVFALKKPMFYQDSTLGGQEDVTKLTFNGIHYE